MLPAPVILVYRIAMRLIYILFYPWWRLKAARGDSSWRGRLVLDPPASEQRAIWIHAASVGEVKLVKYLIDYLLGRDANLKIHVTTVTPAGQAMARSEFGTKTTLSYFPLDIPGLQRRFLKALAPQIIVMAEAEFWPNLLRVVQKQKRPLVLVNGRMSEKSHGRFLHFRGTLTRLLSAYSRFFFKSALDQERFRAFGVDETRGTTAGDMKFDAPLPDRDAGKIRALRQSVGAGSEDFLFVVGSTRPPEEEIFAALFKELNNKQNEEEAGKEQAGFRMVLAPRHVNRTGEVREILERNKIEYSIFTAPGEAAPPEGPRSMVLVDRIGVLGDLFLAADLAFVGGTMSDTGGHNILEPVWAGTPVLFGPDIRNVGDLAQYILARNFGAQVQTPDELCTLVRETRAGRRKFVRKTGADESESPSALAGDYILKFIKA